MDIEGMDPQEREKYEEIKTSLDKTLNNIALATLQIRDDLSEDAITTCAERVAAVQSTLDKLSSSISILSMTMQA